MRFTILFLAGLLGFTIVSRSAEPIVEMQFVRHQVRIDYGVCGQPTNLFYVTNANLTLPISNECDNRQGIFNGEIEVDAPAVMYRYVKTNRYTQAYIPVGSIRGTWTRRDTPKPGEFQVDVEAQAWNYANFTENCTVQRQRVSNVTSSASVRIDTLCPIESVRYWQDLEHVFNSYMYQNNGNGGAVSVNVLTQYRQVTGLNFPTPQIVLGTHIDRAGNNVTNYIMTSSVDPGAFRVAIETNGPNWLSVSTSGLGYSTNSPDVFQTRVSIFANYYQLPIGRYEKRVWLTSSIATNTVEFTVYFDVLPFPVMTLSRDNFSFQYDVFNTNGAPQSLDVRHTGQGGVLQWTATPVTSNGGNWLILGRDHGSALTNSPSKLSFYANPAGLATGTYEATIQFGGNAKNLPKQARVSMLITERGRLGISGPMTFLGTTASNPPPQKFAITNQGGEKVSWQVFKPNSTYSFLGITREDGQTAMQGQLEPDEFLEFNAQAWTTNTRGGTLDGTISIIGGYFVYDQDIPITIIATNVTDRLTLREVTPASGQLLVTASTNNFQGTVVYQFKSGSQADLALRLFDQEGNLQGSSEFLRIKNETVLKTNVLKITNAVIGTNVTRLTLKAVLIEQFSLRVIKESELFEYPVKAPLETRLGVKDIFENTGFLPLEAPYPDIWSGHPNTVPRGTANFYTLSIDDPDLEAGDRIHVFRSTKVLTNGILQTAESPSLLVDFPVSRNGETPLIPLVESDLPAFADYWVVQARLVRAGKEIQRSVEYKVRINTLKVTVDPRPKTILSEGTTVPFKFKIEFRGGAPGTIIIRSTTSTLNSRNESQEIKWDITGPLDGIREHTINKDIPVGRQGRLQFNVIYQAGDSLLTHRVYYEDFGSKPFSLAEGAKTVSELAGVDINTLKTSLGNDFQTAAGRTKERVEIAVGLGVLQSWEPKKMILPTLPTNFVTISNTWFFKPSIIETGLFSGELTFHYSEDDLPEALMGHESEMQAVAYYAQLQQWQIIPAQIDLVHKTATFTTDRLADYYSLGALIIPAKEWTISYELQPGRMILETSEPALIESSPDLDQTIWHLEFPTPVSRWTNEMNQPRKFFRLRAP